MRPNARAGADETSGQVGRMLRALWCQLGTTNRAKLAAVLSRVSPVGPAKLAGPFRGRAHGRLALFLAFRFGRCARFRHTVNRSRGLGDPVAELRCRLPLFRRRRSPSSTASAIATASEGKKSLRVMPRSAAVGTLFPSRTRSLRSPPFATSPRDWAASYSWASRPNIKGVATPLR